jgi:hypothetical protein
LSRLICLKDKPELSSTGVSRVFVGVAAVKGEAIEAGAANEVSILSVGINFFLLWIAISCTGVTSSQYISH